MKIRTLSSDDLSQAMRLFRDLVGDAPLAGVADLERVIAHPGTQIFGSFDDDVLASIATLHVLPNITNNGRPYALV